jgi:hypothetical protein
MYALREMDIFFVFIVDLTKKIFLLNMTSLKEKFLEAEGFLSQSKIQMSETIKLRLYGLTKQIKEGDCKMPQPPRYKCINS